MSKLKLQATDGSAGTVSLKAPASTTGNAEFELTLPGSAGSNGQLLSTNGSGVLSWSDDNSGVSLSGSTNNTIATVTGANALAGEANLTFDGTSLGVGTASPSGASGTALEVNGGSGQARLVLKNDTTGSGSTDGHQIYSDGNTFGIQNREAGNLVFETNGAERLRITDAGKVGLNENTPVGDLHITTAGSSQEDGVLYVGGSNSTLGLQLSYDQSGNTSAKITTNSNYSNASSKLSICVDENHNANQLVLTGNGTVGISTTSPTTNLNVAGGFHISGTANQTKTQDGLLFQRNTSSGNCEIIAGRAGGNYTGLEHYIAGASGVTLRQSSDYQGNTKWMSGNGSTELFRIRHDGGVTFNGDTAAANALDDYEEGTFTPVVRAYFNSAWRDSGFNQSPNEASGWYTKVGNLVNIFGRIRNFQLDNNSQGSYAGFGGLPFTAKTGTGLYPVIKTFYNSIMADGHAGFYIGASSTLAYTARSDSAQGHTTWGSGTGEFWYYGFYYV